MHRGQQPLPALAVSVTPHGPGRKHARTIALEAWQQEIVADFTKEFIRGLVHSDGSRSTDRVRHGLKNGERRYEYPRYFFTDESADIMGLFTDALERLGIEWR
jgi:hypothetical protein